MNLKKEIWVRILSFTYSWQGTEATARDIVMDETLVQVFSSEFCEIFKNTSFIEHLQATAFKGM